MTDVPFDAVSGGAIARPLHPSRLSRERVDGSVVKRLACLHLIREWKFDVVTAIPN
jgi:hypothetical protein